MRSSFKVRFLQLLGCVLLVMGSTTVFGQNTPEEDEFLQLLQQELQLQYDSLQHMVYPPYFIAYRVKKAEEHQISANFGHLYANNTTKTAYLTIEIRVGDSETDNLHVLDRMRTDVDRIPIPLDENPVLVRKIIQRETQKAYSEAVLQYAENKVDDLLHRPKQMTLCSFLKDDWEQYYEKPIQDNHWNAEDWAKRLCYCTEEASLSPGMTEAMADIVFNIERNYLVNSANTFIAQNRTNARVRIHLERLDAFNIPHPLDRLYYAPLPEQLPDAGVLLADFHRLEEMSSAVCEAENLEREISCPVLLSEEVASLLVHNLIGHALENAPSSPFTGLLQQQVLPEAFTVYSDPTVTAMNGQPLSGSYLYDDEGFRSQRVIHIKRGVLETMLSTRTQQPRAYDPNGHARGNSQLPAPRQSNLFFESNNPLKHLQLLEKFKEQMRQENCEYGIWVQDAEMECDTASGIVTVKPTFCYQVFANSPSKEIRFSVMRNLRISATPKQWMDHLLAAGDSLGSVAVVCRSRQDDLPVHCCAPELLFRSMPIIPSVNSPKYQMIAHINPPAMEKEGEPTELLFRVAQDEWDIDVQNLMIGDYVAPYYQEYLMTDAQVYSVNASGGSVFYSNEKPVRQLVPVVLLGNDFQNNENLSDGETTLPSAYPMSLDNQYGSFARDIRRATEKEYRNAIRQWETKKILLQQSGKEVIRDRSVHLNTQTFYDNVKLNISMEELESFACRLSNALSSRDFLEHSGVNLYLMQGNAIYWNSVKCKFVRPVSIVAVQIFASVLDADGHEVWDGKSIFFRDVDTYALHTVQEELVPLLDYLHDVKETSQRGLILENGPVLVEGDAVGQLLSRALLERIPNLFARKEPVFLSEKSRNSFQYNILEEMLNRVVTQKNITITANKMEVLSYEVFPVIDQTDAEGTAIQETELIHNGMLVALMGNRTPTKSTPYSNGFQQLGIHKEGCFATRGALRLDFDFQVTQSQSKMKAALIKEARSQGCRYAYIVKRLYDKALQNILDFSENEKDAILQLYRVDVRTGDEVPVPHALLADFNFSNLEDIIFSTKESRAYPVMMSVDGAEGTRDFPFAGVPTTIVAPQGLLFRTLCVKAR